MAVTDERIDQFLRDQARVQLEMQDWIHSQSALIDDESIAAAERYEQALKGSELEPDVFEATVRLQMEIDDLTERIDREEADILHVEEKAGEHHGKVTAAQTILEAAQTALAPFSVTDLEEAGQLLEARSPRQTPALRALKRLNGATHDVEIAQAEAITARQAADAHRAYVTPQIEAWREQRARAQAELQAL